jgi:hypothetical protein
MVKKPTNKAFTINGITVKPGERRYIELPLPGLYTHTNIHMPVHVSCGKEVGPVLFISAAVHGDEINGVEIIRRIINSSWMKRHKGTLVAIPVVNVYGFINKSRYLPDRRDLNRSFPGTEKGSMAAKLAYLFLHKITRHCDFGIDLHTAAISRDNLPQIRAVLDNDEIKELALAFGAPVVLDAPLRPGTLRDASSDHDTKILLYEAGEALRFDEVSIRAGVNGITNVMRKIGMLSASRKHSKLESAIAHSSKWVRAPHSGILRATNPMGHRIKKGDLLGLVSDPFGEAEFEVIAPVSGMVIGRSTLPLVHEGEAIFHIARFDELGDAESALETFQTHHDPHDDDSGVISDEPVIY